MTTTEQLIDALAADIRPVHRLRPPWLRCTLWLGFAAVIVTMLGISHGVRPALAQRFHDPLFTIRIAAALATGVLAALSTFLVSLPDRSQRWALLPVPGVIVWFSTIGYGCLTNWITLGPAQVHLAEAASCFATLVLVGTPLSLALLLMIRRAGPLRPASATICGALAVAAVTAAALSLFHRLDATILILLWNLGVAVLFLALGGVLNTRKDPSIRSV